MFLLIFVGNGVAAAYFVYLTSFHDPSLPFSETCTVIMTFEICSVIVQAFCSVVCCAPLMVLGCCVGFVCVCVFLFFFSFLKDVISLQNHFNIWCILSLYPSFRVCSERN